MAAFMRLTSAATGLRSLWAIAPICAATAFGVASLPGCDQAADRSGVPVIASDIAIDAPLAAEFALADGSLVRLDYLNGQNFRFSANTGAIETLVVDGEIYLHVRENGAQPESLWRYGRLAAGSSRSSVRRDAALRPTSIPPQGVALWGEVGQVFDVAVTASGPLHTPSDATVAKLQRLANAQWTIATTLLPAMNMAICGDGVQELTSWWDAALAGEGWAILATTAGLRLNGPVAALSEIPVLPIGIEVRALPTAADR